MCSELLDLNLNGEDVSSVSQNMELLMMDLWKKFERQHVAQKRGCNLTFVFFPTDYDVIRHIRDDPPGLDLRCICSGTTRLVLKFKCFVHTIQEKCLFV